MLVSTLFTSILIQSLQKVFIINIKNKKKSILSSILYVFLHYTQVSNLTQYTWKRNTLSSVGDPEDSPH